MTDPVGTVASLHRYPVKSMLGEDLDGAVVDGRGLLGDRGYALVDRSDGTVVSAKHPRKWASVLTCRARYLGEPTSSSPLPPVAVTLPDGTEVRSDATGADGVLSRFLGRDVALVSDVASGAAYEAVWPDGLAPDDFVAGAATGEDPDGHLTRLGVGLANGASFVDVAALHLLTTSTLESLRAAAPGVDAVRFRANVVVDTGDGGGFPENDWPSRLVQVGSVGASVLMLTMRCVMTSLGHGDLPADRAVLRAISAGNRREIPGLGTWSCAGVYAGVAEPGQVHVGDAVVLRAT